MGSAGVNGHPSGEENLLVVGPASRRSAVRRSLYRSIPMLETIIIILVVLWAIGFIGGVTSSGLIHILLVIALVILVIRLASGRKVL